MNAAYREAEPQYQQKFLEWYGQKMRIVTFVITEDCNMRCSYCYQQCKNSSSVMTKENGAKAIDMLFEAHENKNEYVKDIEGIILEFIGGEALMEIELIDYMVEYFRHKAIISSHPWGIKHIISVCTNGTLYFNEKVQDFIRRNRNRLSLAITIDGNKELHDSCRKFENGGPTYDIVERAMRHYIETYNPDKGTKLTLAPENISHLKNAIINLHDIGLKSVHANCVFEDVWNLSHAKEFYRSLKDLADHMLESKMYKDFTLTLFDTSIGNAVPEDHNENWCGGTGNMLAIGPDGNIYPCLRYMGFSLGDKQPPIIIGDIDQGIGIDNGHAERISELKCVTRKSQSSEECLSCPIGSGCAWCSAYNYQIFGTVNKRATSLCDMHKARSLANVYYWNKLYRQENIGRKLPLNVPEEWALTIISEEEYHMLKELSE